MEGLSTCAGARMMTREEAQRVRMYLKDGGILYPGFCRTGSYRIGQLNLGRYFTLDLATIRKESHG